MMVNNNQFDPNNWCIKTDKTHPRWEEFVKWYKSKYPSSSILDSDHGVTKFCSSTNTFNAPIHTIDEVLNYYNKPQIGDLCEFSHDGEKWHITKRLGLIYKERYWWLDADMDILFGYPYCRKVNQPETKQENLADKILSEIQKIVETYKNK